MTLIIYADLNEMVFEDRGREYGKYQKHIAINQVTSYFNKGGRSTH